MWTRTTASGESSGPGGSGGRGTIVGRRRAQPVRGEGNIPPAAGPQASSRRTSPEHADTGRQGFAVPDLPPRPSLEHLRKQAKTRKRERRIGLSQAQHELAREYGFASWPKLVHHVQATMLDGIERALVLADTAALARLLHADPTAATTAVRGWRRCWCCCDGRSARQRTSAPAPGCCWMPAPTRTATPSSGVARVAGRRCSTRSNVAISSSPSCW
jgi:hypothetical protein